MPRTRTASPMADAVRDLSDPTACPRCASTLTRPGVCLVCGADLGGPEAREVWALSVQAAALLTRREDLVGRLPQSVAASPAVPEVSGAAPVPAAPIAPPGGSTPTLASSPTRPMSASASRSGVSVQSLLAIAGAGLFAAAAVVFTYLNPDLADPTLRAVLVAAIAGVFGVGAWFLLRIGLRLSAEVVGALGVVLWALDVGSVAGSIAEVQPGAGWWGPFGIGIAVSGIALVAVGGRLMLRTWLWFGAVAVTCAPALIAQSAGRADLVCVGFLVSVVTGLGVERWLRAIARRRDVALTVDLQTVHILMVIAASSGFVSALMSATAPRDGFVTSSALLIVLAGVGLVVARTGWTAWWGVATGASAALGAGFFAIGVAGFAGDPWWTAILPAGALLMSGLLAVAPWRRPLHAGSIRLAGVVTLIVLGVPAASLALAQVVAPVWAVIGGAASLRGVWDDSSGAGGLLGALAVTAGIAVQAWSTRRLGAASASSWATTTAAVALLPVLGAVGWIAPPAPLAAGPGLGVALLFAVGARSAGLRRLGSGVPLVLSVGAHLAVVSAALSSWRDGAALATSAGVLVLLATAAVARTVPARYRFLHTGVGYSYALLLTSSALALTPLEPLAVLCLTVSVGALTGLVTTLADRIPVRHWYAVLAVTAVPFLVGVASVLTVRTGWTALSTGLILLLAVTLTLTTRPGLAVWLRTAAAAIIVPSIAVIAVSLGAQLLATSGSPAVLPFIAAVVALVLGNIRLIDLALRRRLGAENGTVVRPALAIEFSAGLTAVLAVLLALVREAAGLSTTVLVLVILGVGGALSRILSGRRYGWWLAGAAWTGALWSVWAILGVDTAEPYYLPTALAVVVIGTVSLLRGRGGSALVTSGLAVALVPTIVLLALGGEDYSQPLRTSALLVSGAILLAVASLRRVRALDGVGVALVVLSMVASCAGVIRAVRWGIGVDLIGGAPMAVVLVVSGVSVILLALGARALNTAEKAGRGRIALRVAARHRLLLVPALLAVAAGPATAIRQDWASIWALWALTLALLALLVVSAVRSLDGRTMLPRPWLVFSVAWVVAVAGWSPRELRVEWFSVPLGVGVLLAGAIAMRHAARRADRAGQAERESAQTPSSRRGVLAWPLGGQGSWWFFGPGIVLTLLPSVLATGTDPQTWRAILVIALALVAILVGSSRRLAAPFLLGLVVLPVENVVVFAVQIGRNIGALPWWITLATAGIVLLALAVGSERKTSRGGGVGARIRELT